MRIYGYARVSTKEQNLGRQMVDLEKYVDTNYIFTDKQSGKDMELLNLKKNTFYSLIKQEESK